MLGLLEYFWISPEDAASASAAAALALTFASPRGWGAKGRDDYYPLPDDYWEDRKKIIQVDTRDPSKVFEVPAMPEPPKVPDMPVVDHMLQLQDLRDRLTSSLMTLPDIGQIKVVAGRIHELDDVLRELNSKKYKEETA